MIRTALRHRIVVTTVAIVSAALQAACGSRTPPASPAPTPAAVPAAGPAAPAAPTASAESDAEKAKREAADRAAREAALARASADSAAAAKANAESAKAATDARSTLTATVFFDYDASDLRDDARPLLEAKLPVLQANPSVRLRIGGHADDRGSDEYNLALGQRRAAALKRWFTQRGIAEGRFDLASFGEERPTCRDEDETCWVRNRRAEFEIMTGPATLAVPR